MKGSVIRKVGPVSIGCMSPEARDLLDTVMDEWKEHRKILYKIRETVG